MPIAPHFDIVGQTPTHVIVEVHVPHIRIGPNSIQVEIVSTDDDDINNIGAGGGSVLYFSAPPIYLLRLNFAPYEFQAFSYPIYIDDQDDDEDGCVDNVVNNGNNDSTHRDQPSNATTATTSSSSSSTVTYIPHQHKGTVRLELAKLIPNVEWPDLDLMGKFLLQQQQRQIKPTSSDGSGTASSQWLQEVLSHHDEPTNIDDDSNHHHHLHQHDAEVLTGERKPPLPNRLQVPPLEKQGMYGFARMFHHVYTDINRGDGGALAREMLEGPWEEEENVVLQQQSDGSSTATIHGRRKQQRLLYENQQFCPDRYLADWQLDFVYDDDDDDDGIYANAFTMQPHWSKVSTAMPSSLHDTTTNTQNSSFFTAAERRALCTIPYQLLPSQDELLMLDATSTTTTSNNMSSLGHRRNERRLCIGLLDLLFAYVYDHVLTDGDPTVESAWTISKLSASLSWLEDWLDDSDNDNDGIHVDNDVHQDDDYDGEMMLNLSISDTRTRGVCNNQPKSYSSTRNANHSGGDDDHDTVQLVEQVVISSIRRALIFPFIRTWKLALHVWSHVSILLRRSNALRTVIRCLLQIRTILRGSDVYYLGNKLYIDPYLAWLQQPQQSASDFEKTHFVVLANAIDKIMGNRRDGINIDNNDSVMIQQQLKHRIGLDLVRLEADAMGEDPGSSSSSSPEQGTDDTDSDNDDDEDTNDVGGVDSDHDLRSKEKTKILRNTATFVPQSDRSTLQQHTIEREMAEKKNIPSIDTDQDNTTAETSSTTPNIGLVLDDDDETERLCHDLLDLDIQHQPREHSSALDRFCLLTGGATQHPSHDNDATTKAKSPLIQEIE